MTFRLYNDFIKVGRSCPAPGSSTTDPAEEREAVSQLKQLVGQLPKYHSKTLGFLCQHLARVAEEAQGLGVILRQLPHQLLQLTHGFPLLSGVCGGTARGRTGPADLDEVVVQPERH